MVVGLLTAANAAGQLIFLPTNAALITYAGWRAMVLILAGVVLLVVLPLLLLMRDKPQDLGLFAYGDTTGQDLASRHSGNPVAVAFLALWDGARVRDFWLISGGYFVCGASTMGLIGTHLIPACVDHGLTEVTAAGLLAATGIFAVIGGNASSWLSDRFDNRYLLFSYYGLRGLSLLYLPFAFNMSFYGLSLFSVFYGLDWIATAAPTVRLLSHAVGVERIGIMVAWITVIHQIGGASVAYLAGVLASVSEPISKPLSWRAFYVWPPRSWCCSSAPAGAVLSSWLQPRRTHKPRSRPANGLEAQVCPHEALTHAARATHYDTAILPVRLRKLRLRRKSKTIAIAHGETGGTA
jgi:predicted MFS family arabinose efflux permease